MTDLDALLALSVDPFDRAGARDHYGRPIVFDPDGNRMAYRRPSTQAKALDDLQGLIRWKAGMAVRGVAENHRMLVPQVLALDPNDKDGRQALYSLAEDAAKLAGSEDGASLGTIVHTICELIDQGRMSWPRV